MSLQQLDLALGLGSQQPLNSRLARYGQEHLLRFWDELSKVQQRRLAEQIDAVDFELVDRLTRDEPPLAAADLATQAEPPLAIRANGIDAPFTRAYARTCGESALRSGQVGMILVAGGQGTRLGFEAPKGLYPLGPVSQRSLLQILIDRLTAIARRYQARIPLYLMTSPATHTAMVDFLEANDRFGLPLEDLHVFRQSVMPAVCAATGRVLLSDRDSLSLAPDGHGGMLPALAASGGLQDAVLRGVEHFFYCQVDNPLVPCCDPELIGWSILTGAEMTTLAVAKTHPAERLGTLVTIGGRPRILEYSELSSEATERRNADGSLRLWAGNAGIHVFALDFLRRIAAHADALPYHRAWKEAPYVDSTGQRVEPSAPNAIKFERFIFDLLPLAQRTTVVEGVRSAVFAPVKDAPGHGRDTPEAAQAAMCALYRRWLQTAGAQVPDDAVVEIHPHYALDAEELAARLPAGAEIVWPTYLK